MPAVINSENMMKFCAINSIFSFLENVAMKINAVSEIKHIDWARVSMISVSTMFVPKGTSS